MLYSARESFTAKQFDRTLFLQLDKNISTLDARRNQYREELQVAREALASLRSNFKYVNEVVICFRLTNYRFLIIRGNDPNHHTLDTLEQCMAFLLERIAGPDNLDVSSSNYQSSVISRYTNDAAPKRSLGNGTLALAHQM